MNQLRVEHEPPRRGFSNVEGARLAGEKISFSFGNNWRRFVSNLSEEQIEAAKANLCEFTGRTTLEGETFLDLGSGSGLSSLVAYQLGVGRILSVDIDPFSVESTQIVRGRFASDADHWEIVNHSVLDSEYLHSLGQFSYVYSWGVLHHTGDMWKALDLAKDLVQPGGSLHIALYNWNKHSKKWHALKRVYNRSPRVVQRAMLLSYHARHIVKHLVRFKWPFGKAHQPRRGMSIWRDHEDWLGGLPYEYCKPDQVVHALAPHGFQLQRLRTVWSHGCNEYLFTLPK